jgi:hypothetical protein
MRKSFAGLMWFVAVGILFAAPSAFGQVNLYLNNAGNNVMDGVYVGPYNATIGGSQQGQIICDDFKDDTNTGESWLANVTTLSNLNGTKWGSSVAGDAGLLGGTFSSLQGYEAMLYLSSQMLGNKNATQVGYLAYAVWSIFDASGVYNWLVSHGDAAAWKTVQSLAASALKGSYSIAQFAGWQIFTPTKCFTNCTGNSGMPQEFFEYVPEGGTALGYLLVGLFSCLAAAVYRTRRQVTA